MWCSRVVSISSPRFLPSQWWDRFGLSPWPPSTSFDPSLLFFSFFPPLLLFSLTILLSATSKTNHVYQSLPNQRNTCETGRSILLFFPLSFFLFCICLFFNYYYSCCLIVWFLYLGSIHDQKRYIQAEGRARKVEADDLVVRAIRSWGFCKWFVLVSSSQSIPVGKSVLEGGGRRCDEVTKMRREEGEGRWGEVRWRIWVRWLWDKISSIFFWFGKSYQSNKGT